MTNMPKKLLVIKHHAGNGDLFFLRQPAGSEKWTMRGFTEFLRCPAHQRASEGFLAEPIDAMHFETLRQLFLQPQAAYFRPRGFFQNDQLLSLDHTIDLSDSLTRLSLCALEGSPPNLASISMADIHHAVYDSAGQELCDGFDLLFDFMDNPIRARDGQLVESLAQLASRFYELLAAESQIRFMLRVARSLHALPFENMSKLIASISMRSGYEMIGNAGHGFGGVCAEKSNLLQFLCDVLAVETSPVIGCADTVPADYHDQLKRFLVEGDEAPVPPWAQHYLLELRLGDQWYLIDATGGNLPLLFLSREDSAPMFQTGIRARMVYHVDRLKLGRISRRTADMLSVLSQFHVPDLHLQYVFEQGLGLHVGNGVFIGAYFDWGGERTALMENYYSRAARAVGFPMPRFLHESNLQSLPIPRLEEMLRQTLGALRNLNQASHYTGDFTFVIQPLNNTFWSRPRLSACVQKLFRAELGH